MAVKINNNSYSGFFLNGEALTAIYLNGNQVFSSKGGDEPQYTQQDIQIWSQWDEDYEDEGIEVRLEPGDTYNLNVTSTPAATVSYEMSSGATEPPHLLAAGSVDKNGIVTCRGGDTIFYVKVTAQGFTDNVNHIIYNTTTKLYEFHIRTRGWSHEGNVQYKNVPNSLSVQAGDSLKLSTLSITTTPSLSQSSILYFANKYTDPTKININNNILSGISAGYTIFGFVVDSPDIVWTDSDNRQGEYYDIQNKEIYDVNPGLLDVIVTST